MQHRDRRLTNVARRTAAERSGAAALRLNATLGAVTAAGTEGVAAIAERAASRAGKWADDLRRVSSDALARGADQAAAAPLRSTMTRQVC